LRERYEQLRRQTGTEVEAGAGRSVLQREGMKAWIEAGWREVAPRSVETPTPRADGCQTTADNRKQIVVLLAGMVMGSAERSWR
jgi:hypothetical protein